MRLPDLKESIGGDIYLDSDGWNTFLSIERKGEILSLIMLTPLQALDLVNYLKKHTVVSNDHGSNDLPSRTADRCFYDGIDER